MNSNNYSARVQRVAQVLHERDHEFLFVTPGADLRYLTGYDALPLERLTCLAIKSDGSAWMIVPALEHPAAIAHGIDSLGISLLSWTETQNPYELLVSATGKTSRGLVNNLMWVEKAFNLRDALGADVNLANDVLSGIREIKSADEISALHEAGAAIDAVHGRMGEWLRPGRTEREVGRDIADAIIKAGHVTVDFVIVASGPNGASPHHEVSDRVIQLNDPVVVDIGGTMPSGYCSDSTRTYACGGVDVEYRTMYEVLQRAQQAAVEYARPGVTCESVDGVARDILSQAGLGEFFIHRIGHGIGMETHEEPYMISGNTNVVQEGHAFSIEPGFYIPGKHGARIEDIVTCNASGVDSANNTTHDLVIL